MPKSAGVGLELASRFVVTLNYPHTLLVRIALLGDIVRISCQKAITIVRVYNAEKVAIGAHRNGQCVTSSREADVPTQKMNTSTAKEDGT